MAKINFEDMPVSAQKIYKRANTVRKVTMFISVICSIIFFMFFAPYMERLADFFDILLSSFLVGGVVNGIVHCEFIFKKIFRNESLASALLIWPIFLIKFVISFFLVFLVGWICTPVDLVLFIMKKPLVYPFEHESILMSKAVQREMEFEYFNQINNSLESDNAVRSLESLNEMKEKGFITEEEFNKKKEELLKKI